MDSDRIGLIVVHGIGEPVPGDALSEFSSSLEVGGLASFDDIERVQRLREPTESTDTHISYFPAHVRTGRTAAGIPIAAAEVYWGSASQLAPGRLGVVQGTVSLLLNVPALVFGADIRRGGLRGMLQDLAWSSSLLLSGPGFALNTFMLALLLVHAGVQYATGAPTAAGWRIAEPLAAACLTTAAGFAPWYWFPETRWSFWLAGPIVVAASAAFSSLTPAGVGGAAAVALEILIVIVAVLLLVLSVAYAIGRLARTLERTATTVALGASIQFGLWALVVPTSWPLLFQALPRRSTEPWMPTLFARVAPADGMQLRLAAGVLLVTLVVVVIRAVAARRQAARPAPGPAPRLIVNDAMAVAIIAATTLGCAMLLAVIGRWQPAPGWIARAFEWMTTPLAYQRGAKAILLVLPLLVKPLRTALDLAQDVIFYIYYGLERGRGVLSRARRGPSTSRNPVRLRFRAVVTHLLAEERISRLLIVAHSQGTVIALDELAHGLHGAALPPVTLVTFGSPITHLYQTYFPNEYPGWGDTRWDRFFSRVERWINCYRIGDYVGTRIDPAAIRCDLEQAVLGAGGHSGYWTDPRLIQALRSHDLFATPGAP
jgi:hypothetical protein